MTLERLKLHIRELKKKMMMIIAIEGDVRSLVRPLESGTKDKPVRETRLMTNTKHQGDTESLNVLNDDRFCFH